MRTKKFLGEKLENGEFPHPNEQALVEWILLGVDDTSWITAAQQSFLLEQIRQGEPALQVVIFLNGCKAHYIK